MSFLDVFKPKWQSSDLTIRKQAVQSLSATDLDALLYIATNEGDANLRKLAIQKISSPEHLNKLLETEQDSSVRGAIKEVLKKSFFKTVKNHIGKPSVQIRKILEELPVKDKEELLPIAKSTEVRLELVNDCTKQGVLAGVAKSDTTRRSCSCRSCQS